MRGNTNVLRGEGRARSRRSYDVEHARRYCVNNTARPGSRSVASRDGGPDSGTRAFFPCTPAHARGCFRAARHVTVKTERTDAANHQAATLPSSLRSAPLISSTHNGKTT